MNQRKRRMKNIGKREGEMTIGKGSVRDRDPQVRANS